MYIVFLFLSHAFVSLSEPVSIMISIFVLLNQLPLQGVDWWALGVLLFEMMAGLDNTTTLDNSKSRT